MKKTALLFAALTLILIPHQTLQAASETKPESNAVQKYNYSPDQIVQNAKLVAKIKWETYPSPHIISVMVEKVYWGKGDIKKGIGGWIEGKNYSLDLTPHAWEKSWEAMNPKFVPLGKENIVFIDSLGKLIGLGEIKGGMIILTCSLDNEKCLVGPKNEIALSSLKEIK